MVSLEKMRPAKLVDDRNEVDQALLAWNGCWSHLQLHWGSSYSVCRDRARRSFVPRANRYVAGPAIRVLMDRFAALVSKWMDETISPNRWLGSHVRLTTIQYLVSATASC